MQFFWLLLALIALISQNDARRAKLFKNYDYATNLNQTYSVKEQDQEREQSEYQDLATLKHYSIKYS